MKTSRIIHGAPPCLRAPRFLFIALLLLACEPLYADGPEKEGTNWLDKAVQALKQQPGKGLFVGGLQLPLALAELGLIDEYVFVVQPRLAGHGPTLFAGLSRHVELRLVSRREFGSGAVVLRYEPRP